EPRRLPPATTRHDGVSCRSPHPERPDRFRHRCHEPFVRQTADVSSHAAEIETTSITGHSIRSEWLVRRYTNSYGETRMRCVNRAASILPPPVAAHAARWRST